MHFEANAACYDWIYQPDLQSISDIDGVTIYIYIYIYCEWPGTPSYFLLSSQSWVAQDCTWITPWQPACRAKLLRLAVHFSGESNVSPRSRVQTRLYYLGSRDHRYCPWVPGNKFARDKRRGLQCPTLDFL